MAVIPQTWADAAIVALAVILALTLLAYLLTDAWQVPGDHRRGGGQR